jgi:hypothetical protein
MVYTKKCVFGRLDEAYHVKDSETRIGISSGRIDKDPHWLGAHIF